MPPPVSRYRQPECVLLGQSRLKSRIGSLVSAHEIAHATPGVDVAGIAGVVAQLAAQAPHQGTQRSDLLAIVRTPHPAKQLLVGHHPSGIGRQLGQHPVLGGRQLHR